MRHNTPLNQVFGISGTASKTYSYVDRGGLDERLKYLLGTERHIAIHGDSKQGKSWLRSRALDEQGSLVIQCQPDTTPESILQEALGRIGIQTIVKRIAGNNTEGTLEVEASGEVSAGFLGKLGLKGKAGGKAATSDTVELTPIGQGSRDLSWVAEILRGSRKRLVIEDFHYLSEDNRRSVAYILKALYDYQVFVLLVGVWPQDHLLPYYNGDLDGRVEDIHLTWSDSELERVLSTGSAQLDVSFSPPLRRALVADAYSNVGLLQRLAEQLCVEERIISSSQGDGQYLTVSTSLDAARRAVADGMRHRYQAFADNFVRGMRRLPEGLEVYKHLLQVLTESPDESLLNGLDSADLLRRLQDCGHTNLRQSDLTRALERVDRLQAKISVRPAVLTYNHHSRRVYIVDRAFLFFRKYGDPIWPWESGTFDPTNDLAAVEPLDLN